MKTILLVMIILFSGSIAGQSAQLSTFEEMWVLGVEFNNFKTEINGFNESTLFTESTVNNIKSFKDLNKIIADTPFLSIRLVKGGDKFEKESKEYKGPIIHLSERSKAANHIKGWGSFLVLFEPF